ncbi:hypothetical protein B7P43_G09491 [Cryptotermes secundus]|uniref:Uncharacterized protein n=1 Tax=Cryptotermes secundus TaxID=105785 RepID=A0A2J7PXC7_9NEOP|nr:hypothetical protein B7P43_G09491 [Cryptotermes secundus]
MGLTRWTGSKQADVIILLFRKYSTELFMFLSLQANGRITFPSDHPYSFLIHQLS